MQTLQRIALTIAIIGAINWGLIGFFNFDLVATIFGGQDSFLSRVVYSLVGISGLICLTLLFKPWEEEQNSNVTTKRTQSNFNLGTEFGEETDFSSINNSSNNPSNNSSKDDEGKS